MKILLDTNFIVDLVRFKIRLETLDDVTSSNYTLCTTNSVIHELERISARKGKSSAYAKAGIKLVESYGVKVLKSGLQTDKALLELAKDKDFTVATNDRKLRKTLKSMGRKTIYLKSKKHLAIG